MLRKNKRQIGEHYEALAKEHMLARGLSFIDQNYNTKLGEIDLIMKDGSAIVFVEVKYRKTDGFGNAAEFVNHRKATRLIRTVNIWLKSHGLSPHTTEFRIDVIAVHASGGNINWIKNAITEG
ncbi:YraN family protein [Vibrio sp. JC009]|uniref:YraN family protein n=1 Tax=Vibrio sp. JC009 TaxID=2912314 RepID=UPI0023B196E3|nr:YraN family protein [Vibrio sp. JC009]WED21448.1 YraN family protein [Vibrio sp. JC009]